MESKDYNLFPAPSLPATEIHTLIERLLGEEPWEIRAGTAKELGQRGDLQAVEPLCIAVTDKIWRVRIAAVGALGRLKDARAVEALCGALQDTDWYIRVPAAVALREIGDIRAVEPLCSALEDTESSVRSSAAEALGHLGDLWAVEALCSALKDWELEVRLSAAGALDRLGSAETLPLRVLSATTLPPAKLLNTLQALTDASPRIMVSGPVYKGRRRPMRYILGNVQKFCESVCGRSNVEESVKRGAEAVLLELRNRADADVLLRASAPDDTKEKAELLRGVSGLSDSTPPAELLRASDTPSESLPNHKKPGFLARTFMRK